MSSNWVTTTRTFQTPLKLNGDTVGVGAATAASYEINPMGVGGLDNSIFRISASKVIDDNLAATPSDEVIDDDAMKDYLNRMTDEFEATMQLSEEASRASRTSLADSSLDGYEEPDCNEPGKRRAPPPPVPHLRDLTVVDPFDPFRKQRQQKAQQDARRPSYKVVKGRAPQPPDVNPRDRNNSLHRVIYNRADKRLAPLPPVPVDQDFWPSGAVGMRVRRAKRKNEGRAQTVSHENISLTFREKMARFFGLTGNRKKKERSRALTTTFSGRSSEVLYGPSRYGSTKTLQSFSFAHSKIYSPRANPEPVMGGGDVDIVRPQANGMVRVQRHSQGPVLQSREVRWSNRESALGGGSSEQAFIRRSDYPIRPHDNFNAHF